MEHATTDSTAHFEQAVSKIRETVVVGYHEPIPGDYQEVVAGWLETAVNNERAKRGLAPIETNKEVK